MPPGTIASPAPLSDFKIIHIMRNGALDEIIC
jgi:hypothetical protein